MFAKGEEGECRPYRSRTCDTLIKSKQHTYPGSTITKSVTYCTKARIPTSLHFLAVCAMVKVNGVTGLKVQC